MEIWEKKENVPQGFWKDFENQKRYIKWLGNKLNYKTYEDWYQLTQKKIKETGGWSFSDYYFNGSTFKIVKTFFPEYEWLEWLFVVAPSGFWNDIENQKKYIEWLGKRLKIEKMEDWYLVDKNTFRNNYGSGLEVPYGGSPSKIMKAIFPNYPWKDWLFSRTPKGFWGDKQNRINYMKWAENELEIKTNEDWYRVSNKDLMKHNCGKLINNYSIISLLKEYKPEYDWLEWKISQGFGVPNQFWQDKKNRIRCIEWLGKQLNYTKETDWYNLSAKDIEKCEIDGLFQNYYGRSFYLLIKDYLGDNIKGWLFEKAPQSFWENLEFRLDYLRWLGNKLNYKTEIDWYKISTENFRKCNGGGLLTHYYGGSAIKAVKELFPNYPWQEWLFERTSSDFWKDIENQKRYMNWLGEKLNFKESIDFYNITSNDFRKNNGASLLCSHYKGSPALVVMSCFPNFPWEIEKFYEGMRTQKKLCEIVREIFPNDKVEFNYSAVLFSNKLRFKEFNRPMQMDVFVPSKNLALEYQSELHFFPIEHFGGEKGLKERQNRDEEKRIAFNDEPNLNYVEIDYKWNGEKDEIIIALKNYL